jgi:PKD repeat protein
MKHFTKKLFMIVLPLASFLFSCKEEKVELPTSALIHYSVADKQVAFAALAHNADSYLWDFGDGETSTEKDPVHIYAGGGYYTVILTVSGGTGEASDSEDLAIALTPYVLLTGGANNTNGKTWKLNSSHSKFDYFANADASLSPFPGTPVPLPAGVFGQLDMGEVYLDTYTFHYDGSYSHDVKEDMAAFSGLLFQFVTTGGAGIVNAGGQDYGLCTGKYTPQAGATFTYVESENFDVPSVYDPSDGKVTYSNVSTLDFSGTEFVGFADNQRKVIIQDITNSSMRLVMFAALSQKYYPLNTHALVLTFEAVN